MGEDCPSFIPCDKAFTTASAKAEASAPAGKTATPGFVQNGPVPLVSEAAHPFAISSAMVLRNSARASAVVRA
ncbi:hypothetical protein [Nioella ostreopsis]|uniref:hypothetical protein n=1 Tax=Nioella ostreopsis TaxID=2448479 RepID=UPI000FDC04C1